MTFPVRTGASNNNLPATFVKKFTAIAVISFIAGGAIIGLGVHFLNVLPASNLLGLGLVFSGSLLAPAVPMIFTVYSKELRDRDDEILR